MSQSIFVVQRDGDLLRMRPSAPPNEDMLQDLIARHPAIIGDADGELLLIRRVQPIRDAQDGGGRWALDHLFVTRAAVPVLVEVKRAADTRLRREVVGQMLDYAANGVAFWPAGMLAEAFVRSCEGHGHDPAESLAQFLGDGANPQSFWEQVDANFRAGNIKLVFVADEIPRELARIVEFLNEQMSADVRAVELRYFEGDGGIRTLAPRIIGETERAQANKAASRGRLPPMTREEWVAKFIAPQDEATRAGFARAIAIIEDFGAEIAVASTQGSVFAVITGHDGRPVYPMHLNRNGTIAVSFSWVYGRPGVADEAVRQQFLDRYSEAVGPLSTSNIRGYPAFPMSRLQDAETAKRFESVTRDWFETCR